VLCKYAIHPAKINTPKFKEVSLLIIIAKGERGHRKKYMLKKHIKNVLQSKSTEKRQGKKA
jgi:hypothetical protein